MHLNYLSMFILIFFTGIGCSQKNMNPPEAAPLPVQTAPEPKADTVCGSRFGLDMSLAEIAVAAANMRQSCGYSEEQIYNLAQKKFKKLAAGAGVMLKAENPIFF